MEQVLDKVYEWGALYGMKIFGAALILILGRLAVGLIAGILRRVLTKAKADATLTGFLVSLTKIALLAFVVIAALNSLGVQTASFIAVIGAAGLAIGFALQGSLSNFASGVMLVIFHPLKAGDLVEAGGTFGVVKEVRIFNTVVVTPDNKRVIVPNSKVTGDNIVNYSVEGMLRVDLIFGIGYGDLIPKAKKILEDLAAREEHVLTDPAPTVAVLELGDSSVNFAVRPYVKPEHYWAVYFGLTEKVKLAFDEQGVSIPFPQRDVHMYQASAA